VTKMDRKGSCILAWALTLAVPIAVAVAIGWPWLARIGALEEEIGSLDEQITRYYRLLKTLPVLEAELEQVRSNKDVEGFYFDAKTPALAGAELQRQVQGMVESSGGRVVSTQVLPSNKNEQPPTVRVRTQMQGSTEELLDVLYQVEKARPFLFVDQLTVRAPRQTTNVDRYRNSRVRRPVRERPRPMQLTIRLDVFGYALGEAP